MVPDRPRTEGDHCSQKCLSLQVVVVDRRLEASCRKFDDRLHFLVGDGNCGAWVRPVRCARCKDRYG